MQSTSKSVARENINQINNLAHVFSGHLHFIVIDDMVVTAKTAHWNNLCQTYEMQSMGSEHETHHFNRTHSWEARDLLFRTSKYVHTNALAGQSLDEVLHSTTKSEDETKHVFFLVVVL